MCSAWARARRGGGAPLADAGVSRAAARNGSARVAASPNAGVRAAAAPASTPQLEQLQRMVEHRACAVLDQFVLRPEAPRGAHGDHPRRGGGEHVDPRIAEEDDPARSDAQAVSYTHLRA